ncbi:MAG: DUF2892 domain-containing protein [Treponema sp.]|nr:DUF2892 domain-containing protein [Treponema sp.]
MKQNEGTVDRIIRVIVGIVVAIIGIVYHSWWGLLALIPLLTAATGVCLLYLPFHISTRGKAAAK